MSKQYLVVITPEGRDVSEQVETRNGKANPFGWSTYDLYAVGRKVCNLYCGEIRDVEPGWRAFAVDEDIWAKRDEVPGYFERPENQKVNAPA